MVEHPERFLNPILLLVLICQLVSATLVGVLAETAGSAYADVTTSTYTIGSPSPAVTSVTASPSGATVL